MNKNVMKNDEKEKFKKEFAARLIKFSVSILKFADILRKNPTLWSVADQTIRSSTSVGANVCEARGASSKKDFAHFFQIALKSAKETQYWLLVIEHYDHNYKEKTEKLSKEIQEITKILNSSLLTLKGKK